MSQSKNERLILFDAERTINLTKVVVVSDEAVTKRLPVLFHFILSSFWVEWKKNFVLVACRLQPRIAYYLKSEYKSVVLKSSDPNAKLFQQPLWLCDCFFSVTHSKDCNLFIHFIEIESIVISLLNRFWVRRMALHIDFFCNQIREHCCIWDNYCGSNHTISHKSLKRSFSYMATDMVPPVVLFCRQRSGSWDPWDYVSEELTIERLRGQTEFDMSW